ncbi:glycerophosphodiester phosphodiesterase family protein [Rhodobacteraceae bacterium nBUS_24]
MNPLLPDAFRQVPLAHRGYHGGPNGVENSREAIANAVANGYGIELDLQLSADGQAMVFHDDTLDRMTCKSGQVLDKSAAKLGTILLSGGQTGIPTLAEILKQVAGKVPLLIEIKYQNADLGPTSGQLERATAAALQSYSGAVAVMSFNPHSVAHMAKFAPKIPRGLTTDSFAAKDWPDVPEARLLDLQRHDGFDAMGAVFISHDHRDLANSKVAEVKSNGLAVLCWTVTSEREEIRARRIADNITFEGYPANIAP